MRTALAALFLLTSTLASADQGKMGKKDSPRPSGAYAQKRIDKARQLGIIGVLEGVSVEVSIADAKGPYTNASAWARLEPVSDKIQKCAANKVFSAKVSFKILPSGKPTAIKIKNVKGKRLRSCIRRNVRAVRFDKKDKATSVSAEIELTKSPQGGAFASLTGTGDFSSGLDDADVYGGLLGNEVGEMSKAEPPELRGIKVDGPLSWADVKATLGDPLKWAGRCAVVDSHTVDIKFQILATGAVSDIKLSGGTSGARDCILKKIETATFKSSALPTKVSLKIYLGKVTGAWGYGVQGIGPGGGGTGWGTIGLGKYGNIGHGSGTGTGYGTGGLRGRPAYPPQVKIGKTSSTGNLDKNIIRRYVRRKLPRIRNCYEKELLVKPTLKGTLTVKFVINGQGRLDSVKASGLKDRRVASCVEAAIKSIQFPKPKGGGKVTVRYPFAFKPATKGKSTRPPQVRIGNASATSGLDKNIIRRYIRRRLHQIRKCYERELLLEPNLQGTLVMQFQIMPDGLVANATGGGLGNATVTACVEAAIESIQFPKPKGGGLVNVRYPFTFRPAP
jgi:outer membrane biosynthesis protein TonB